MPHFVLAYRGVMPEQSPEDRQAYMARWRAWVAELGAAAINPGTPLGKSWLVRADGVSPDVPDPLTGYSVVAADDLEAALEIARRCPYGELAAIEVAEARSL